MKTAAIIEARMGSTRLPGKVMKPLAGTPLLTHVIRRAKACRSFDTIILATTTDTSDDVLERLAVDLGIPAFRGSSSDVLSRVLGAAHAVSADLIVKLSGDNPLYHPEYVDPIVAAFDATREDFISNTAMGFSEAWKEERTWPVGTGVMAFTTRLLADCQAKPLDDADREHVIRHFVNHPQTYRLKGFHAVGAFAQFHRPELRLCVDTAEDYDFFSRLFTALSPADPLFGLSDAIAHLDRNPDLLELIRHVKQRAI